MTEACSVLIWDRKEKKVRPCGNEAKSRLTVSGDALFAVCHRHDERLNEAFPTYEVDHGAR